MIKFCKICDKHKKLIHFGKNSSNKDKLNSHCLKCANKKNVQNQIKLKKFNIALAGNINESNLEFYTPEYARHIKELKIDCSYLSESKTIGQWDEMTEIERQNYE